MVLRGGGDFRWANRSFVAHVDATYDHRALPADLTGLLTPALRRRFAVKSPGGRLSALAEGRFADGIEVSFRARLIDAGGATRLLAGSDSRPRSMVLVEGRLSRSWRHPAELHVHSRTVATQ
jgi:hypothetical protein